jgi:hypothetical protein
MTNKGTSEQLISLEVEITSNDKIGHISKEVHEAIRGNSDLLHYSMYAMISTKAEIKWENPDTSNDFVNIYNKSRINNGQNIDNNRTQDTIKYSKKMIDGEKFPKPILHKRGDVLIQIDGARRLMASLLANQTTIDIIIVLERKDIQSLLEPEFIEKIHNMHFKHKWFKNYQEIIEIGLPGSRKFKGRFPHILDLSMVRNKIVTDFGCSNGMALFQAYYCGAQKCVGFEHVQENVDIINALGERLNIPVKAYRIDFNERLWLQQVINIVSEWDYSMFLSVYRTKELKDRVGLVKDIWKHTKIGMIFEGHSHPNIDTHEYYMKLFNELENTEINHLPRGIIERPYDSFFRPKYLLKRQNKCSGQKI